MSTKNANPGAGVEGPPAELIQLAHDLGQPEFAILADGNVSCLDQVAHSAGTFWVKASGTSLATAAALDMVHCRFEPVLALLEEAGAGDADDARIRGELVNAKVDPCPTPLPSIETLMHAVLLRLDGVRFVGHTHPTAINKLTCSTRFEEALAGRVFPEEVVVCGPASVFVPYVDPGVPLGREVKRCVDEYIARYDEPPRAIYLQSHGFIAIGATAREVLNITMMAAKAAAIRLGALAAGGLKLLSETDIERIHSRSDIRYRKRIMAGEEGQA